MRSFAWQGGAQIAGQIVSWIVTVVVIRVLSPADYGLMAMANVFLGFFFLFADLGFGTAAVQAQTLNRDELRRILGVVLATNVGGFVMTFATAPLVAAFFGEPRLTLVIRILSVNFLLLAAYVLPQSQLVREMDFRTKAGIDTIATVLMAVTAFTLATAGWGVWALVAGSLVTHGVRAAAYNIARPLRLAPTFTRGAFAGLVTFSALVTLDRLLFFLYGQVDVLIGGKILGKEAIGLYAVALSLAVIPMEKILPVITQVSFAAFSRIQGDLERVRRNLLRGVQLVSLACFPACLGMAAVAGDLVPIVLGPRWVELIIPFQLLCLVLPLKAVAALYSPALFGIGRPAIDVGNMVVALVTMSAAILVGARFGVTGICAAWVVAYPVVFVVITWRSLRVLGVRPTEFIDRCAFPAIASCTMVITVLALREALQPLGVSVLRLALLIAAGALMYGGCVLLFQRAAVRDLVAVVRS